MKLLFSLILFAASSLSVTAQNFFMDYLNGISLPMFREERYLDVVFTRDMNEDTRARLTVGLSYMKEREFEVASKKLTDVLSLDSKFCPAFYYRGICNAKQGKFNEAEKDF